MGIIEQTPKTEAGPPPLNVSMSAYLRNHERERSSAAGCQSHLVKPFRLDDLEKALQVGK